MFQTLPPVLDLCKPLLFQRIVKKISDLTQRDGGEIILASTDSVDLLLSPRRPAARIFCFF